MILNLTDDGSHCNAVSTATIEAHVITDEFHSAEDSELTASFGVIPPPVWAGSDSTRSSWELIESSAASGFEFTTWSIISSGDFDSGFAELRNRLKLFWNYFWKNPPPIIKLQVLTSRLIPKISKKSNKNLLFRVCKVFEFSKMHFWPWKRPKTELLSS